MTIAERRLIDAIRAILKEYDDDPEYMHSAIDEARKLVDMLEPAR